jgi:hypothetical protein
VVEIGGQNSPLIVVHHMNDLFKSDEAKNLDADCEDVPLRFQAMSNMIGLAVQTGWVVRELANSDGDSVFMVSAEEPASVGQAVSEAPWHWAMEEELQAIEENHTCTLTELPPGWRDIGLKWVFKVKRDERGQSCDTRRGSSSRDMLNNRELITMRCSPQLLGWKLSGCCSRWPPRRGGRSITWT